MTSILLGSLLFLILAAIAGSIIAAFMLKRPESPINRWRRKSSKSMLCRAYSDGLISSFQLHELAAWADQLPKLDRKKPDGGYASKSVSCKPQFALALAFVLIGAGTIKSEAQTNNFFQTTYSYFTSFDTNNTCFRQDWINVSAGTASINNQNMTEELSIEVSAFKFQQNTNTGYLSLDFNYIGRNATFVGTLVQQQGGIGLSKSWYDVKASVYVDGGYDFTVKQWYPAAGIMVKKALTPNTYSYVGLEEAFRKGNTAPTFRIGVGFKL